MSILANGEPTVTRSGQDSVDVSVLVPTLNEQQHLEQALATMQEQDFDGTLEFLLIDGGSTDRTRELTEAAASRDPRVRLLDNPARRTPNALNIGLRAARGEFVARMDAHTRYPPTYLATGVQRLLRGDVEWVAGPQLAVGAGVWSRRVALALSSTLGTGAAGFRREITTERDTDSGFTGVWRRSTLEAHGGWDEGWPINQDGELAARVRKAGGRIVTVPAMAATYIPRDSLIALGRQYWRYGTYRVKTSRRHPETMRRSHALAPALSLALVTSLVGPRPLRRLARLPLALYGAVLLSTGLGTARRADTRDAAALPVVFATMHLAWGLGFLNGCARYGPPLAALRRLIAVERSSDPTPQCSPVSG